MQPGEVEGLLIVKGCLEPRHQDSLIAAVDAAEWSTGLRRRVQHFGYRYDYGARSVNPASTVPPMPDWASDLLFDLHRRGVTTAAFDQLIVNEYLPGQGIAAHIDSPRSFGEDVLSVSLGSACVLTYSHKLSGAKLDLLLEPGDVLSMRGDARYRFQHEIKPRKRDIWHGQVLFRQRRLSLTFRTVLAPQT